MMRSVGAVLAGAAVWAVLWIGGTAGLAVGFPEIMREGEPLFHVPILLVLIALSVVFSIAAGYLTGVVAARREVQHALALGGVQLALGIYFETTYWELMPLWYHLTFLALLVPANVFGGWMRANRNPVVPALMNAGSGLRDARLEPPASSRQPPTPLSTAGPKK